MTNVLQICTSFSAQHVKKTAQQMDGLVRWNDKGVWGGENEKSGPYPVIHLSSLWLTAHSRQSANNLSGAACHLPICHEMLR